MAVVLGLNAFHADAAAALVRDGRVVAAVEEERFSRVKHSAGFPLAAVRYCLEQGGVELRELDAIAVGAKPIDHVQEDILQILSGRPNFSRQIHKRLDAVARFRDVRGILARELGYRKDDVPRLEEVPHHEAHAASAFYASGEERAALLTVDGFGDFCSTWLGRGGPEGLEVLDTVRFPHSLGIFYTMVTQFLGFGRYGDEGKLLGLAAQGEPIYRERLRQILKLDPQGTFELDPSYFTHPTYGVDMIWEDRVPLVEDVFSENMIEVFGPPRHRYAEPSVRDKDLAASVQAVTEEAVLHLARRLKTLCPDAEALCYAGTMALNCGANTVLRREGPFARVQIPSAPTDAGTALGAALVGARRLGDALPSEPIQHAFFGPRFSSEEIERELEEFGVEYVRSPSIHSTVADLLAQGKIVGWFRGRAEFGPRALGGRSILADPRRADVRERLNTRVKFREAFRPFAASIMAERQGEATDEAWAAPFMLYSVPLKEDFAAKVPGVVHHDGTCRMQTVDAEHAPDLYRLLAAFAERTGVPMLLNTSFNENEPMVCTPKEALECFTATKMDALAIEDYLIGR